MDNQVHQSIVSFIWGIADDCLRDVYVRGKYRDVILPMTVIRRLDALLQDKKENILHTKAMLDEAELKNQWPVLCNAAGHAFCNASAFCLRDLTSRGKPQTLKRDFEEYLDGFSPNVQEILDKFKFRNQIDTLIEADILGAVIEKFISPDINLSPNPVWKDDAKTILRHPGLDNHGMGTIFEELIRRFNEENNEEAGEHWTPKDVVELMADLIFIPIAGQIKDATYSCYDGACGTGGMLTIAQDRLTELAAEQGKQVSIHLFGQEVQPETYAICKADMLLKGDGDQAEHIMYGSTLSNDQNASRRFDFMLSNPPYGKSWKTDAEKMGGKKDIQDCRFNALLRNGVPLSMIPRTSDGQLLFLLNNVSKMKQDTPLGSRIAEVHNGSSIFTGDAGSGESNARRYMIENDLVEAVIALPENMFYNTSIGTVIWVLSNRKEERRKGRIQLIDATGLKTPLRKNMGKKNCELTPDVRKEILRIFLNMEESPVSRVLENREFGYWCVTVDRPLRQKVVVTAETLRDTISMFRCLYGLELRPEEDLPIVSPADILAFTQKNPAVRSIKMPKSFGAMQMETVARAYLNALCGLVRQEPYIDYNQFLEDLYRNPCIENCAVKFQKYDAFLFPLLEKDPDAAIVRRNGEVVPDVDLRDTENIPFSYPGGIDAFIRNEVLSYAPDAYVDPGKTQTGYEISFTKYFYHPPELRDMSEILESLKTLEDEADGVLSEIMGGIL